MSSLNKKQEKDDQMLISAIVLYAELATSDREIYAEESKHI